MAVSTLFAAATRTAPAAFNDSDVLEVSRAIMRDEAPAVWQWIQFLDDPSGVEGE